MKIELKMAIKFRGHLLWGQWKGDKGLNNTVCVGLISEGVEDIASESPENRRFRLPHCRLTLPFQETPANIRRKSSVSLSIREVDVQWAMDM